MAVLATQARFEQGGWYSSYTRYPFFAERAAWINSLGTTGKIAVAGCGWGYLVDELRKLGRDAYGFDISSYATAKFSSIRPTEVSRVVTADALNATQMTTFRRTTCGLSGSTKIPLIVTEDMLPALFVSGNPTQTETDTTTALTQMRANGTRVVHIVTCAVPTVPGGTVVAAADLTARSTDLVWRTHQGWKDRIGNSETVLNAEGGAVL